MSANNTENRKFSKNKNKPRQPRWDNDAHNLLSDARGADALRELRALGRPHQFGGKPRSMLPSFSKQLVDPNNYGEEGVDHINVSSQSKTEIGSMFSLENKLPYLDQLLDTKINSLRTFTLFLKTGMVEPLMLVPYGVAPGVRLEDKHARNSFALQAYAIWQKLQHYPQMTQLLLSLNVPLDWYIVNEQGKRHRTITGAAYVCALRMIRDAYDAGEAPDFTPFFDLDVQDELNRYERIDRMVRGMQIIQEQLQPTAERLKEIKLEREQRQTQKKEQPAKLQQQRKPAKQHKSQQRRNVNLGSLNHMVPSMGTAAPQADAAPVVVPEAGRYFGMLAGMKDQPACGGSMLVQDVGASKEIAIESTDGLVEVAVHAAPAQVELEQAPATAAEPVQVSAE